MVENKRNRQENDIKEMNVEDFVIHQQLVLLLFALLYC